MYTIQETSSNFVHDCDFEDDLFIIVDSEGIDQYGEAFPLEDALNKAKCLNSTFKVMETIQEIKQLILNDFNNTFNQNLESFEEIEDFFDSERSDGITENEIDDFDNRNSNYYSKLLKLCTRFQNF